MLLMKNSYDSLSINYQFLFHADSLPAVIVIISMIVCLVASEILASSNNCAVPENSRDYGHSMIARQKTHSKISERNANAMP